MLYNLFAKLEASDCKDLDGDKLNEKISEIVKDIKEHQRKFFQDENELEFGCSMIWLHVSSLG